MENTNIFPTWCPGCGDFAIWGALKNAIKQLGLQTHQYVLVYDIGCHGNMSSFNAVYGIKGLHGRAISLATGIKLANHQQKVIVITGDGGLLGEGMSHFVSAARSNQNITVILHNNQIYGLTTGQSSPTSMKGTKGKATPLGVVEQPVEPCTIALVSGATFVARGFAGDIPNTGRLMAEAITHPGFSFLEVLQPCVTFNKLNTYDWFRQRTKVMEQTPLSLMEALEKAQWQENQINLGTFKEDVSTPAYHQTFPILKSQTLIQHHELRDLSKYIS